MLTYKKAGVDIVKKDRFIERIKNLSPRAEFLSGLYEITGYKNPVIVARADGVGTKTLLAVLLNKHFSIGVDVVAMNVNDVITKGAKPLFFLDYISFSKFDDKTLEEVINGVYHGCKESGCILIGGETAQMPGLYKNRDYDIAGFAAGVVEKSKIIKNNIKLHDVIIGIPSSGVHSNGFSLIRKVFTKREIINLADELMKPTRIYVSEVSRILKFNIRAIAHITGGGLIRGIKRMLPSNLNAVIYTNSWDIPQIFYRIMKKGNIDLKEMYGVFNMGIGMVVVINRDSVEDVKRVIKDSYVIGEIVRGNGSVVLKLDNPKFFV